MFNRVAVWLDEYAPDKGAFAFGSDWAARLHIPLHVVAPPDPAVPLSGKVLLACEADCTRKGLSWNAQFLPGAVGEPGGFFLETDLSAFSLASPAGPRDRLLREALASQKSAVMVCPAARQPPGRTLILQQGSGKDFLDRVVPLCSRLAVRPVVLSVAPTEGKAEERQELAREVWRGLDADFDLIAGCDVRTAVERAARARGCSHVILERENDPPWRRWLRRDAGGRLLGLADRLTLVMFPGTVGSVRAD